MYSGQTGEIVNTLLFVYWKLCNSVGEGIACNGIGSTIWSEIKRFEGQFPSSPLCSYSQKRRDVWNPSNAPLFPWLSSCRADPLQLEESKSFDVAGSSARGTWLAPFVQNPACLLANTSKEESFSLKVHEEL